MQLSSIIMAVAITVVGAQEDVTSGTITSTRTVINTVTLTSCNPSVTNCPALSASSVEPTVIPTSTFMPSIVLTVNTSSSVIAPSTSTFFALSNSTSYVGPTATGSVYLNTTTFVSPSKTAAVTTDGTTAATSAPASTSSTAAAAGVKVVQGGLFLSALGAIAMLV